MAYITAEDVNHIRVALKKEFPQYKFSVTRDHHLGVNINFMEGPRFAEFESFDRYTHETTIENLDGHHQINHFHLENFYGEENAKILGKVSEIAHTAPGLAGGKVRNTTTTMIFRVTILMLLTMCQLVLVSGTKIIKLRRLRNVVN